MLVRELLRVILVGLSPVSERKFSGNLNEKIDSCFNDFEIFNLKINSFFRSKDFSLSGEETWRIVSDTFRLRR